MKKSLLFVLIALSFSQFSNAQQDPMFTKYMFNTLVYNPAYAGAKEHLSAVILHRDQWLGFDGAPTTQTFTLHSPMKRNRVALGASLVHDNIGATKDIKFSTYYAYRISLSETSKLSFGLSTTINNFQADWSELSLESLVDPSFTSSYSKMMFNAGAGLFYYNDLMYLGLSVPHLLNGSLIAPERIRNEDQLQSVQIRHYYLAGGLILPLNSSMVFKPSFLIKNSNLFGEFGGRPTSTVGAPTEFDIDVSLLMYDALWVGMSFRSAFEKFSDESSTDSFDIWAAYYLRSNVNIGLSFDFTLNELSKVNDGSFEIILGYDFAQKVGKMLTPRYFW